MRRLFFDISFTRTQEGNVGITRTVRRLGEELGRSPGGEGALVPVAFHSGGYRIVPPAWQEAQKRTSGSAQDTFAARFVRWLSVSGVRKHVLDRLPAPLVQLALEAYNALTFDRLTASAEPARFARGDLLLMCDAAWCGPSWRTAAAARAQGARVVLLVHDLIPLRQPEFSTPIVTRVFGRWLQEMLAVSDAVICNSRATETELRDHAASQGLALPPTSHFRLGADLRRGSTAGACRPELEEFLRSGSPCFAAVGTIEPRKNHAFLLAAFERLWAAGHSGKLLVIGRVNAECRELAGVLQRHPEQGVRLLSLFDASDAEVALAYQASRALVFPSLAEGFGLPLVEARASGCPVIASDIPAFAELADAGVFLYAQHSMQALQDAVLAQAARDHRPLVGSMPPFSWSDSAREFLAVADRLLDRASTKAADEAGTRALRAA